MIDNDQRTMIDNDQRTMVNEQWSMNIKIWSIMINEQWSMNNDQWIQRYERRFIAK